MSDAQDDKPAAPKRVRRPSFSSGRGAGEDDSAGAEEPREAQPCVPCRGSGKVISNLGGRKKKVTCPWCRGGGERLTGVDAQEWQQEQSALKSR